MTKKIALILCILPSLCSGMECEIDTLAPNKDALKNQFCQRLQAKIDNTLQIARTTYQRLDDAKSLPFPYTWQLNQVTETALIFNNTHMGHLPAGKQFVIAVSRESIITDNKLRSGAPLFSITYYLGHIDTIISPNIRGFDVKVRRYDAIYPLLESEIKTIISDIEQQNKVLITRYSVKH